METVVVFLDYANIDRAAADKGYRTDYAALLGYLSEGRFLQEAYCYVPIDPRAPYARDAEIEDLWSAGYLMRSKPGVLAEETYKCNFDVEITLDLMRVAEQLAPAIIVLASGDGDFVPVLVALRERGIRVEVAAFVDNAARAMILKSSGFIDLEVYYRAGETSGESGQGPSDASAEPESGGADATADREI